MRCDYKVVRLFFTLHTQKQLLLTSVGKRNHFARGIHLIRSSRACVCTHGQSRRALIFLPSHVSHHYFLRTGTEAYGVGTSAATNAFLKFNALPGRCPLDKQRNNHPFSEDFVRMVLPSCPVHIFPIKLSPAGIRCLYGWQAAPVSYFVHIL